MLKIDLSTVDIAERKEVWELSGRADMWEYIRVCKIEMSSLTNLVCDPLNFQRKIDKKTGYFGCSYHE
jgi:hypothetical protein